MHCYVPTLPTAKIVGKAETRSRRVAVRIFKLKGARHFVNRLNHTRHLGGGGCKRNKCKFNIFFLAENKFLGTD